MKTVLVATCLLLTGCDQFSQHATYQIIPNGGEGGGAWRLNTATGEVKSCVSYAPIAGGPVCYTAIQK